MSLARGTLATLFVSQQETAMRLFVCSSCTDVFVFVQIVPAWNALPPFVNGEPVIQFHASISVHRANPTMT